MNILDIKNKKGDCIFANHIYDDNTRSYMTTISIFDIVELLEVSKLICDPAYQRDFVATLSWQSDFVMSLLEVQMSMKVYSSSTVTSTLSHYLHGYLQSPPLLTDPYVYSASLKQSESS